jgi:threonine/homoserine/homoserine lactone efflux protein
MSNPMSPGEMLFRVAVGGVLVVVGLVLQAAWLSMVIIFVGAGWIGWTVWRAVRQVREAERIEARRRD